MKKMTFYIITLILAITSCNEAIDDLPPCNEANPCANNACEPENCVEDTTFVGLDTLWKTDMEGGNIKDMYIDDESIYVNVLTNNSFYIASYSRSTGDLNWRYSNELGYVGTINLYEGLIIGQTWNNVFSLNKKTGEEIKKVSISNITAKTSEGYVLKDYYYTTRGPRNRGTCIRSHVNDLENWEEVYQITQAEIDGFEPNTVSYNLWDNPETRDEILVFQHRMAFPDGRIDLMAYNMTADSVLWWHKDIDEGGNSNQRQITLSQGRAYFQGTSKLRCFDIASGDLIWETNYGPWNQGGKFFAAGSIVFTASKEIMVIKYATGLLALNALTGQQLWDKNDDDIHNTINFWMTMYNDIVFFTHVGNGLTYNGPLWAIRASDGEEIWMKSTDFVTTGNFNGPVLIDEERLLFYTRHEGNLIAFRMPEDMY